MSVDLLIDLDDDFGDFQQPQPESNLNTVKTSKVAEFGTRNNETLIFDYDEVAQIAGSSSTLPPSQVNNTDDWGDFVDSSIVETQNDLLSLDHSLASLSEQSTTPSPYRTQKKSTTRGTRSNRVSFSSTSAAESESSWIQRSRETSRTRAYSAKGAVQPDLLSLSPVSESHPAPFPSITSTTTNITKKGSSNEGAQSDLLSLDLTPALETVPSENSNPNSISSKRNSKPPSQESQDPWAQDSWGDWNAQPEQSRSNSSQLTSSNPNRLPTSSQESKDQWAKEDQWKTWAQDTSTSNSQIPPHTTTTSDTSEPTVNQPPTESRPSNVPPPSALLILIPTLTQALLTTATTTSGPSSTPTKTQAMTSMLHILIIAARIIAGRKLRWKRDHLLSQRTKIGPATTGGKKSGMKLMGVDRNESIKEEQGVTEVAEACREHVKDLKHFLSPKNNRIMSVLLDVIQAPHVRTATAFQGALTASHCCPLCGLKRDERVEKLDDQVQDSFGEFWVELWGHAGCRNFWHEYKSSVFQ
ncbi:MAG: hypothetical protein M1834_009626 [Cirrosporium novae-zelandiae]|nr:MAG: hypothetical protein M1834_009626 [Cirrosporium novae-zelandiae]